jgi:hypothetical protein
MASKVTRIVTRAAVAAIIVTFFLQNQALRRLRWENAELRDQIDSARPGSTAGTNDGETNELAELRAEHKELLRLRGELGPLRERAELLSRVAAANTTTMPPRNQTADIAWVKRILDSPPAQQGAAAGALRAKLLGYDTNKASSSEIALRDALLERQLNSLERSPADFAEFQSAFIQSTLGIGDPAKVEQIRQIIRQTYDQAVSQGLDIPSKPATDTESWVQRRYQLDRMATGALKQLFTPEEQRRFDRAFLGVMGVDLGGIGVDRSNYPPGVLGPYH